MRSMTFLVNDQSSGGPIPAVAVTITENTNGSLSFSLNVLGPYTGDLRGFFFDLANESRIGTLSVAPASAGFTEFRQGNDSVKDLGNGANMQGLLGSDGGYDAGVEIGTSGIGKDDYQSFGFTLASSAGPLTLEDFSNVDFGVRLTSVGLIGGSREDSAKLLEHTSGAINAQDDANSVDEDAPNPVSGDVFANDSNLGTSHAVTAVNGFASKVGVDVAGTYGTLHLNADGTYTYTLDNTNAAVQALADGQEISESFAYTAKNFDELTSFSTDTAVLTITITGANDGPAIIAAVAAGAVTELADGSPDETTGLLSASGTVDFTDADLLDAHTVAVAPAAAGYLGTLSAAVTSPGQVTWGFDVADGDVEYLGAGESLTQSYTLAIDDGHGGTATQAVTITITGSNDAPVITGGVTGGAVTEDAALAASGALDFGDIDRNDVHGVSATSAASGYVGTFHAVLADDSTGDGAGQAAWNFEVSNGDIQYLGAGQNLTQTYAISVDDGNGGTATQDVTITIAGVNDAPVIAGTVLGQVYEDGEARVARGQLAHGDVDNGAVVTWSLLGPSTLGFGGVSVDATGQWTYNLNSSLFAVQQLAQGTTVQDTFTVRATDQFGAFDDQVVTVNVSGTGDRPNLPPTPLALSTSEDGLALGATSAFDFDAGDVLHWSLNRGGTFGYFSDYEFRADSFSVEKNGATIFQDAFDGGGAPPFAPNFSNNTPANYTTTGLFVEVDGKLLMRGDNSFAFRGTGNDALIVGNEAILATNTSTLPADQARGLRKHDQFEISGVFDLIEPQFARQQYGLTMTDGVNQVADDLLSLTVRRQPDGLVYVRFVNSSAVEDTSVLVDQDLLTFGAATQIRLKLSHEANAGDVAASYELLDSTGAVMGGGSLGQAPLFGTDTPGLAGDDGNWTRAGLFANAFDADEFAQTLAGNHGTLTVSNPFLNNVAELSYTPGAGAQALAQGESAVDTFFVRAIDPRGMSSSQRVNITVNGANDAPMVGGTTSGQVYEDGAARVARGQLAHGDVDNGAIVTWSLLGPSALGFGGVSVDATGQWTYNLNSGLFAVQQLAQGTTVQDTFTVRATDQFGAFDDQVVTVNVSGTGDRPNLPAAPLALSVNEDGGPALGATSAFDVDAGDLLHWSLNRGSALGYFSDYEFRAESFSVSRNGVQIFHDPFDAGGPPPAAPNFSNNTVANYTTTGLFQEIGGKLVMRGSDAFAFRGTGNNALVVGNEAILATNVDPANTVNGLKKNHQFVVDGVFDLIEPALPRQAYGLTLTDGVNQIADDLLGLTVRRDPLDGQVYVQFVNNHAVFDTSALVERDLLVAGGADQIRLVLSHEADSGDVSASYELLTGGMVTGTGSLGQVGIFGTDTPGFAGDDENWIRAGLFSNATDPNEFTQTLAGTYGTLTVNNAAINNLGELSYTPGAAAQALAQGESAVDTFFVRAIDPRGMSSSQRVNITVTGANDAPTEIALTPGTDAVIAALSTADPDAADTFAYSFASGGAGFALVDSSLVTASGLSEGSSYSFTLRSTDPWGSFVDQQVSVTTGTGGADVFDFDNLGDGVDDVVVGFTAAAGDALDIRDVLEGVATSSNIDSFVQLQESGGGTAVRVNADGAGSDFLPLASLHGVTGLLLQDLLANGNLLT